jgi:adenylate cyclase
MPPPPISLADPVGLFSAELPARIEQGFERRALAPRIGVVLILLLGALADYGHGERTGHWVVLGAYGLVTLLAAAGARARSKRVRSWLPLAATCADAAIAVYVVADHVPRYSGEAHLATDAVSLLPAYLFLLQTGMRLRPRLAALFAALVSVGWATALAFLLHPARLGPDGAHVLVRQGMGLAAFAVASGFVVSTTAWMRSAAAAALRAGEERLMLSRFLPDGVATEVVRTGGTASVAERHATLLSVDLRGSSALARAYPPALSVAWLLDFRRLVHDAVATHGGVVDKYVGDGVLALFLDGDAGEQAGQALAAAEAMLDTLTALNRERSRAGCPTLRVIAALHCGPVLAGVFDDERPVADRAARQGGRPGRGRQRRRPAPIRRRRARTAGSPAFATVGGATPAAPLRTPPRRNRAAGGERRARPPVCLPLHCRRPRERAVKATPSSGTAPSPAKDSGTPGPTGLDGRNVAAPNGATWRRSARSSRAANGRRPRP